MRRWLCSAHPESISEVCPAPPPAALSPALLPAPLAPPQLVGRERVGSGQGCPLAHLPPATILHRRHGQRGLARAGKGQLGVLMSQAWARP